MRTFIGINGNLHFDGMKLLVLLAGGIITALVIIILVKRGK